MRMAIDPWGRAAPRTVPLETALRLRDQAQEALQWAQDAERRVADTEAALREARAELAAVREAPPREAMPPQDPRAEELLADLANVRRHQGEAVARAEARGRWEGLAAVADAADDLLRAVAQQPDGAVSDGLRALHERLIGRLRQAGVDVFAREGEPFDPRAHEAIGQAPGPEGVVVAVERRGLREQASGTIIRPAQVVVGQGRSA